MSLETFRQSPEDFSKFVENAEKANLSPDGWYVSVPAWTRRDNDEKGTVRLYGEATLQEVSPKYLAEHPESASEIGGKTRLGLQLSFNDPSDFSAKITAAAFRAYTKAYGKKPESPEELVNYLVNYPFRLRANQGKANEEKGFAASMMVVDIRATEA